MIGSPAIRLPGRAPASPRCPCGHQLDPRDNRTCDSQCADTDGYCEDYPGCCGEEHREARRRCASEACDEFDGIHCYGDGCAMARKEVQP